MNLEEIVNILEKYANHVHLEGMKLFGIDNSNALAKLEKRFTD